MNQHPQPLPSYQRETICVATTADARKSSDGNDSSTNNGTKDPLLQLLSQKWRKYFGRSMWGVFSIAVTLGMIAIFFFVTTTERVRHNPTVTTYTASRTSTVQLLGTESDSDHHYVAKQTMAATAATKHQHRTYKIREQLKYIQEHINGTIYFPPCKEDNAHADNLVYDSVSMGWIKQHPLMNPTFLDPTKIRGDVKPSVTTIYDDNCYNHNNTIGIVVLEVQNERDVQLVVPILAYLYQNYNFPFRIRSGGHHKLGYSSLSDIRNSDHTMNDNNDENVVEGVVLSLSLLNQIRLVPSSKEETNEFNTVGTTPHVFTSMVIGPAVLVQDVLQQVTLPYMYGGVIGFCSNVAEGGFVLGGGFGIQSRIYGLGLDSVIAFRIVLYNGTVLKTSSSHNSDLHWALLGAGSGSYGVVTEIEYQIHPVSDILHILTVRFHDLSTLAYYLFHIGKIESTVPDNVVMMYDGINAISLWWTGASDADVQNGNVTLQNLVESVMVSNPIENHFDTEQISFSWTHTFGNLNSTAKINDDLSPYDWGEAVWVAGSWTGFLLPENNTIDIWNDIVHQMDVGIINSRPYLLPDIELWGGDISRRASNATAFPYRDAIYNVGVLLMIPLTELNGQKYLNVN